MSEAPDIQASLENADEIAELTGRSKADVIADLLDDGKLNNSNAIKENTSAIDRATEMANKTHKLLTALIPILLLLSTSGLELTGIIDLTPAGNGDDDEWFWEDEEYEPYWGCTDWDAINYDEYATDDDGSCEYEEEVVIEGCTDPEANNYYEEATTDDGSCEYDPEECEPFYYDYYLNYADSNNSSLIYQYDVDLPCDETQEVEVQFLAYVNNSTDSIPENYSIDKWNVYNGDAEYRNMTLALPKGFYDIYAYIINEEGVMQDEKIWRNIEIEE